MTDRSAHSNVDDAQPASLELTCCGCGDAGEARFNGRFHRCGKCRYPLTAVANGQSKPWLNPWKPTRKAKAQ